MMWSLSFFRVASMVYPLFLYRVRADLCFSDVLKVSLWQLWFSEMVSKWSRRAFPVPVFRACFFTMSAERLPTPPRIFSLM